MFTRSCSLITSRLRANYIEEPMIKTKTMSGWTRGSPGAKPDGPFPSIMIVSDHLPDHIFCRTIQLSRERTRGEERRGEGRR
jgi:hypothetical protein